MDFNSFFEQGWNLDTKETIEASDDPINTSVLPYINGSDAWDNYTDDITYETDKRMRAWLEEMSHDKAWMKNRHMRKYMFSQIFRILFDREYDSKKDGKYMLRMSRIFAYYCTSMTTSAKNDKGEWRSKTGYVVSATRLKRPPYSLRLRFEWLSERGILPTAANMKVPKDNLKAGQARNPKTNENMQRRKQQQKDRYNEYQRQRNREIEEGTWEGRKSR